MKNILVLLTTLLSTYAFGQESATTTIGTVKQVDQTIEFTVESTNKFYVGGNIHILHIGNKSFKLSKLSPTTGKSITFLIPAIEFNNLVEDEDLWMSYGEKFRTKPIEKMEIKKFCEASPNNCWYFGKFSKKLLNK